MDRDRIRPWVSRGWWFYSQRGCAPSRAPVFILCGLLILGAAGTAAAQRPPLAKKLPAGKEPAKQPVLPSDRRLQALHEEFVAKAERLAAEYEGEKQFDKAKAVYEQILRLVPQYQPAQDKVDLLRFQEATANLVTVQVWANRDWQDTGVVVLAGRPVMLRARGQWTFNFKAVLGPGGMEIPKELREFNLGCLVGVIDTGNKEEMKPFVVGPENAFVAEKTGKLYLRMYDLDPSDNQGSLHVEIIGTYQKT
jgi:hypothetical protein